MSKLTKNEKVAKTEVDVVFLYVQDKRVYRIPISVISEIGIKLMVII